MTTLDVLNRNPSQYTVENFRNWTGANFCGRLLSFRMYWFSAIGDLKGEQKHTAHNPQYKTASGLCRYPGLRFENGQDRIYLGM